MKIGYRIVWFLASILIIPFCLDNMSETTKHCGKIVKIIQEQSVGGGQRSRGYVERMVLIDFNDLGMKAVNLNATSYYTSRLGQNVCIDMHQSELGTQNAFVFALFMTSCSSALVALSSLIAFYIEF